MALTPEEVVNKRFQPTKFREGYDQDEVDDFLDEVVTELRRLSAENEELREKLGRCERRVAELTGADSATADSATAGAATADSATAGAGTADVATADAGTAGGAGGATPAGTSSDASTGREPQPAAAGAQRATGEDGPEAAAGMLLLAQKLHDDYVRSGEEQRDRIVGDAQEHATRLVQEAEERQRETLGALERERSLLQRSIDELRAFERDYRARLRSYLESQLQDLETRGVVAPDGDAAG